MGGVEIFSGGEWLGFNSASAVQVLGWWWCVGVGVGVGVGWVCGWWVMWVMCVVKLARLR